jgi:hypothetical protein
MPVCLFEPVWHQFEALLPIHPVVTPRHPLGCQRPRVPDQGGWVSTSPGSVAALGSE